MNFYIDFEATQPEGEIISIGVVSDNGNKFYSLVKPQFSKVSKYITDMTGLTNEMLEEAKDLDSVMFNLYFWCQIQEYQKSNWHFYSYGDGDIDFLKNSLCNLTKDSALIIASLMIATMKDYSTTVRKYFHGTVSLIKAYNYLKDLEDKQNHNALEDAKMLAEVFAKTANKEPLTTNPFKEQTIKELNYTFPSGKFFCKGIGKKSTARSFECIQDAIEWLINTKIGFASRDAVHRDKMAMKIMKAIRKKDTYMGYNWRREKGDK